MEVLSAFLESAGSHPHICVWCDWGSMYRGARYFITFIDDHSSCAFVFGMEHKSDVKTFYLDPERMAQSHTGRLMPAVGNDRGGECLCNKLQEHFLEPWNRWTAHHRVFPTSNQGRRAYESHITGLG